MEEWRSIFQDYGLAIAQLEILATKIAGSRLKELMPRLNSIQSVQTYVIIDADKSLHGLDGEDELAN